MWGGGSVNPTKFLKPVESFKCRVKPIANTNDLLLFCCREVLIRVHSPDVLEHPHQADRKVVYVPMFPWKYFFSMKQERNKEIERELFRLL
jgi:hypothetical protein